jgi:hypothetical protein
MNDDSLIARIAAAAAFLILPILMMLIAEVL